MKGKAIIELTDKNGVTVTHEHNLVTNCIRDFLVGVANSSSTGYMSDEDRRYTNIMSGKYKNLAFANTGIYGIKLFGHTFPENADGYLCYDQHIGYGDQSTTYDEQRGVLNVLSTCQLKDEDENVVGVRLVWDFPTNTANGTIKSICLTPRDNISTCQAPNYVSSDVTNCGALYPNKQTTREVLTYDKVGKELRIVGDEIWKERIKNAVVDVTGWHNNNEGFDKYLIDGYNDLYKVYDFDGYYITIARNKTTGLLNLLKLNTSFKVTETTELTGIATEKTYRDFCVVGDTKGLKQIIFQNNQSTVGATPSYVNYNLTTKTLTNFNIPDRTSFTNGLTVLSSYKTYKGEIFGKAIYSRCENSAGSESYTRWAMYRVNTDGELVLQHKYAASAIGIYTVHRNFGLLPMGVSAECPVTTASTNPNINYHNNHIGYENNCLFTINNLASPLEKTDANTMKITYELTWGEVAPN